MIVGVRSIALLAFALCFCLAGVTSAQAAPLTVSAPEAVVIDGWNGDVLFAKNANVERYPASTVKIMTALLVLQSGIPMRRVVTVSPYAANIGGSTAGLWPGEQISVWNLLHGMLMPSGNDAAFALAEAVSGTEQRFVARMNAEATTLHLFDTHYLSPNGFDTPGQVTTAHDLANLTRVAMSYPRFARVVRTRTWTARAPNGTLLHHWTNLNRLLWGSSFVDGVKTGTTLGAGACLVSSERRSGKWVIEVNLGSYESTRFSDGRSLLQYGLAHARPVPPAH
jgi:D-alanyl-D-alanine carboxypeptidase (penicillin-binding protein 5/6)